MSTVMPESLSQIHGVPDSIAPETTAQEDGDLELGRTNRTFTPTEKIIAKRLRDASTQDPSPGLSWSALAHLIEDETFAQALDYIQVAHNSTEHSEALTASQLQAIFPENHRYAPAFEYFFYRKLDQKSRNDVIRKITLEDPKPNMFWFLKRLE